MSSTSADLAGRKGPVKFALYVHLPFCRRRCAYCDFVSFAGKEEAISPYIEWVLGEWQAVRDSLIFPATPEVTSCYLGGGTPSLLSEAQVEDLVEGLFSGGVAGPLEFTVEANPESLTPSKLRCYKTLGINRISLGVQSFSDGFLRKLGRIHTSSQAEAAIRMIHDEGWENWNIDLMYGLPGQTPTAFERDLDRALAFEPPHLSAYCLTLAPETSFGRLAEEGRLQLPEERDILEMMDILEEKSARAGLFQYETSNFAREGFACAHNLTYWHLEPYVGIGVGAVSYFRMPDEIWGGHWENPSGFPEYIKMVKEKEWQFKKRRILTKAQAFAETLLVGLRLTQGISMKGLQEAFGGEWMRQVLGKISFLMDEGWLETKDGVLRLSPYGSRLLDTLLVEIISSVN